MLARSGPKGTGGPKGTVVEGALSLVRTRERGCCSPLTSGVLRVGVGLSPMLQFVSSEVFTFISFLWSSLSVQSSQS